MGQSGQQLLTATEKALRVRYGRTICLLIYFHNRGFKRAGSITLSTTRGLPLFTTTNSA